MTWTIYRDVFGGWRWECDIGTATIDSQHSYDTRKECAEAAENARSALLGRDIATVDEAQKMQDLSLRSRSILCVQPKHNAHGALQRAFQDYALVIVDNGFEALRHLNAGAFDGYVLEYWLPDWSGTQLCREIRKTDPHVPICFYVSASTEEQRKRTLRAGANSYICMSTAARLLRHELDTLLLAAEARSAQAKAVAEVAVERELIRCRIVVAPGPQAGKKSRCESTERTAKAKARKSFIDGGGTLSYFEKNWRAIFNAALANLPKNDAERAAVG